MEIREWIRSLGDRAKLLVIIPLVAGSIAALVTLVGPSTYTSSATVIVAEDPASGSILQVMQQRVADLTAAIRSEGVLDAVSRETGVSRGDLGSIGVTRSGSSGVVTVTYSSSRSEEVSLVAEAVARQALGAIALARVDAAAAEVAAAQEAYDTARAALDDREAELGEIYVFDLLLALQRRLVDKLDQQNNAEARGDTAQANELRNEVEALQARIGKQQELQASAETAGGSLTVLINAQDRLAKASGSLIAAEQMEMSVTRETRQGKLQDAARRFLFVAVIGFFVALGLVILLQVMDRRREQADESAASGPVRRPAA